MALRGTLTHRKTRRLAQVLGISWCFALGIQESLWHVTAEQAPTGAIGRLSNNDIAMEMFYDGDPDALVRALISSELLEEHAEVRLVVHDWHVHSDDATDNKLARSHQRYANGMLPRMRRLSKKERDTAYTHFGEMCGVVATQEHAVRTESHGAPPPEPVPEPEPEPGDRRIPTILKPSLPMPPMVSRSTSNECELIATAVMRELGIAGGYVRTAITDVARSELSRLPGITPDDVREGMIAARREYEKNAGKLKWPLDVEKFFGRALWKNKSEWPWKDGMQPAPQRKFVTQGVSQ